MVALLLALTAVAVLLAVSYDGTCGGFMPWLASAKSCGFADYLSGNLMLLALIFWVEFWPIIIVVLALPVGVGYMLDRRAAREIVKA